MEITAIEIAERVGGELKGQEDLSLHKVSKIDAYEDGTISFLANKKYQDHIAAPYNRAILVPQSYVPSSETKATLIYVQNVYESYAQVAEMYHVDPHTMPGIHATAIIDESAEIASTARIGAYTVIGPKVEIKDHVSLGTHVSIGYNVTIGAHTRIGDGVRIKRKVVIGSRCQIYDNTVIGSDGFGHAPGKKGYTKIPHLGSVILEDDVEIGANCCIDRAAIGNTIIRKGAKIDNLVQIAHGVEIGQHVAIAAQTGVSGSSEIGAHSVIGGQVGIAGHLTIAPGSQIQAKSGLSSDIVEPGKKWYGYPILSYLGYLRSYALFKRLPELLARIKRLEDQGKAPR